MEKGTKAKETREAEKEEKTNGVKVEAMAAEAMAAEAAKQEAKHSRETVGNAARKATEHSNADPRQLQQTRSNKPKFKRYKSTQSIQAGL